MDLPISVGLATLFEPWADQIFAATPEELDKLNDKDAMLRDINSSLEPDWGPFLKWTMQEAFRLMGTSAPHRSSRLRCSCQERNLSMTELIELYSLKMRIMLAHQRMQGNVYYKDPSPKRPRVDFEDDAIKFEKYALREIYPPIPIRRYFNGETFEAMELLSDGFERNADFYIQGPQGFAVAMFRNNYMKLKVPNTCVSPDRQLVQHQPEVAAKSKSS